MSKKIIKVANLNSFLGAPNIKVKPTLGETDLLLPPA